MEYYCHTSLGLVAIMPLPGLPTAVELVVAGQRCGSYMSADAAARAVASSSTGHTKLDSLPCWSVPALLSDWRQSLPLHAATGTVAPAPSELLMHEQEGSEASEPETHLAFDYGG